MGLCIFDIDNLSFCLKFPVLQDERHVAVLGIVADVGDADTVATRASGTTWTAGDRVGITDIGNDSQYGNVPFILKNGKFEAEGKVIYIEAVSYTHLTLHHEAVVSELQTFFECPLADHLYRKAVKFPDSLVQSTSCLLYTSRSAP